MYLTVEEMESVKVQYEERIEELKKEIYAYENKKSVVDEFIALAKIKANCAVAEEESQEEVYAEEIPAYSVENV